VCAAGDAPPAAPAGAQRGTYSFTRSQRINVYPGSASNVFARSTAVSRTFSVRRSAVTRSIPSFFGYPSKTKSISWGVRDGSATKVPV